MDFYPFVKCLRPQRIRNKYTKELLLVSCGKCPACRAHRGSVYARKCNLESMVHNYSYFVTLTYRNDALPICEVVNSGHNSFYLQGLHEEVDKDTGEICKPIYHEYIPTSPEELQVLDLTLLKVNMNGYLPYLCKSDLQKFLKRLRKRTDKYEKIRFFGCGELGPLHFRPHFHLLLWFESEELAQNLREIVSSSWPFGRIDVQKSRGDAASYVAKYVNSLSNIPSVFKQSKLQPFCVHSQFLGEEILSREKEEVYSLPTEEVIKRCLPVNGIYTDVFLWRSLTSVYFPKCKSFAEKSDYERLYSYRIYETAREWTQEIGAYRQAIQIVEHICTHDWQHFVPEYQELLEYFWESLNIEEQVYNGVKLDDGYYAVFDKSKLIQQIYRELSVSKRFLKYCCSGDPNKYSHWQVLQKIKQFYADKELLSLGVLYSNIEESFENGFMDIDDLNYVYADTYSEDLFMKTHYYSAYRAMSLYQNKVSQKHKQQNDANKIFCYY